VENARQVKEETKRSGTAHRRKVGNKRTETKPAQRRGVTQRLTPRGVSVDSRARLIKDEEATQSWENGSEKMKRMMKEADVKGGVAKEGTKRAARGEERVSRQG